MPVDYCQLATGTWSLETRAPPARAFCSLHCVRRLAPSTRSLVTHGPRPRHLHSCVLEPPRTPNLTQNSTKPGENRKIRSPGPSPRLPPSLRPAQRRPLLTTQRRAPQRAQHQRLRPVPRPAQRPVQHLVLRPMPRPLFPPPQRPTFRPSEPATQRPAQHPLRRGRLRPSPHPAQQPVLRPAFGARQSNTAALDHSPMFDTACFSGYNLRVIDRAFPVGPEGCQLE